MTSNAELIKKAHLTVADLEANGGKLNPEQSNAFIQKLIEQPTILNVARTVRMTAPQRLIEKIGFGTRIMHAATSGTALNAGDRAVPTTEKLQLSTKEVIAEVNLPYDVIEDNIERGNIGTGSDGSDTGGGIVDTIMNLIAQRAAADLEELALLGDTGSGDTYLAQLDGYIKQANVNVVDWQNGLIDRALFKKGVQTIEPKYLRNRASMRHYVSVRNEIEYRDTLADRQTGLGDAQFQGTGRVFANGIPLVTAELMPETNALTTNPQNLIWGVQRDMHFEVDKDIRQRLWILVLTLRIDFLIEEAEAIIKYENIQAT